MLSGRKTWCTTSMFGPFGTPTRTASSDPAGQRVRPQERARAELVTVQERVAELQERRSEPVLARLVVTLHELVLLERAEQPVHGRLRQAETLGELRHPEPRLSRTELAQDGGGAPDRLDHARHHAARSKRRDQHRC